MVCYRRVGVRIRAQDRRIGPWLGWLGWVAARGGSFRLAHLTLAELEVDALDGISQVAVPKRDVPNDSIADRADHEAEAARVDALKQHVLRRDGDSEASGTVLRADGLVFDCDGVVLGPDVAIVDPDVAASDVEPVRIERRQVDQRVRRRRRASRDNATVADLERVDTLEKRGPEGAVHEQQSLDENVTAVDDREQSRPVLSAKQVAKKRQRPPHAPVAKELAATIGGCQRQASAIPQCNASEIT